MNKRLSLSDLDIGIGKQTRLHRMLYGAGPGGGTMMVLPVDHGLEHGPRDFFENPDSLDPDYQFQLAVDAGFSAIAVQVGLASKFMGPYAGQVPLIVKLNGKTEIPPSSSPRSPLNASIEDAVRLGADAIGYTLYIGSSQQESDFEAFATVRREAEQAGVPIVMWAYPRGEHVDAKGGRDSIYAIDYAARVAQELGADVVKVNYPNADADGVIGPVPEAPAPYDTKTWTLDEALTQIVASAGRTLVIMSGGSRAPDQLLLDRVETSLASGCAGFIFGRNVIQRPRAEALDIVSKIQERMRKHSI